MTLYGSDRDIVHTAIEWLDHGFPVGLVTVARTWGSSPRPVGSLMAIRHDGIHAGSVSGGCVEEDLVVRYRDHQISEPFPSIIDYGVNRDDANRLGLPCGGRLELVVERIEDTGKLRALLETMHAGALIARRVCLSTGAATLHPALPTDTFAYDQNTMQKVFGPAWRMILIGAGHLSRYVASMALMLDYQIIVCDPRDDYARAWQIEDAKLLRCMPDEAVTQYVDHERCVVITLTHDPKLDDLALLEALDSKAFYIGALGSRRSNDNRRKRLLELGVDKTKLRRLHAPVGLAIGSRTPAEIAIAILAEITATRHDISSSAKQLVGAA